MRFAKLCAKSDFPDAVGPAIIIELYFMWTIIKFPVFFFKQSIEKIQIVFYTHIMISYKQNQ